MATQNQCPNCGELITFEDKHLDCPHCGYGEDYPYPDDERPPVDYALSGSAYQQLERECARLRKALEITRDRLQTVDILFDVRLLVAEHHRAMVDAINAVLESKPTE